METEWLIESILKFSAYFHLFFLSEHFNLDTSAEELIKHIGGDLNVRSQQSFEAN